VQFQRRQSLAVAKDEVAEVDKGVVGFGLRASRWTECSSVRKDALMTLVFDMDFPYIGSGRVPVV
jgi:hypothetical protein